MLTEALEGGTAPTPGHGMVRSLPDDHGHTTILLYQTVGDTRYFDTAGYPGRTLGLPELP